ncbi:ABC transporter ATP-binding protein [Actinoallomurus purpureus]|uniref:ABC transporter ATP-binding protein n=1 Tax=Actinoallomurus purpureus TaxID=478114 RepID=UPI002092191A|nr:ABC transporter ATP-binding protein [Actinoallomurus purpureus]MCO6008451.1 ABC transporter ATP-binding protein [Actinoallomurus purpureus]
MTDTKLTIDSVEVSFGETLALAKIDLEVKNGEFVTFVGPSGCGKTTLMNVIAGLQQPTSGRVMMDGADIAGKPGHVGYMFQKDLLIPWRTVTGNIVLGAALTGRATKSDRTAARELAARYGLGDFVDHYPHALSGGMRQRVALMRTLAFHKEVLLLDEPFGALDAQTRLEMQQWLLEVWADSGRTVLFITHDVDEAVFLADRVVVMSARPGRIQDVHEVAVPRPRTVDTLMSPEFMDLKSQVLSGLYHTEAE